MATSEEIKLARDLKTELDRLNRANQPSIRRRGRAIEISHRGQTSAVTLFGAQELRSRNVIYR